MPVMKDTYTRDSMLKQRRVNGARPIELQINAAMKTPTEKLCIEMISQIAPTVRTRVNAIKKYHPADFANP
jgi:hypothetical protein